MGTPFAVASDFEVRTMRGLSRREADCIMQEKATRTRLWKKGWIVEELAGVWALADAGRVALELAEVLDGATLTAPMARALSQQITPPRVFRSLVEAGLLDRGDALTEKGERVAQILRKYRVEV